MRTHPHTPDLVVTCDGAVLQYTDGVLIGIVSLSGTVRALRVQA